jgi:hypothetical protein
MTPILFKYARAVIAFMIVIGSFGFLFTLVYRSVPESNKDLINISAGFIFGLLTGVGAYYYGNSKDKSDSEQAARAGTTTTATTVTKPPEPPVTQV